jgi:hypothetical protein
MPTVQKQVLNSRLLCSRPNYLAIFPIFTSRVKAFCQLSIRVICITEIHW